MQQLVYQPLLPAKYHQSSMSQMVRQLNTVLRHGTEHLQHHAADPSLVKIYRAIHNCRPYGGVGLFVWKGKRTALKWSCKHRLCPYCWSRLQLTPAIRCLTHATPPLLAWQSTVTPLDAGNAQTRRQSLLDARKQFKRHLQGLKSTSGLVFTSRLLWTEPLWSIHLGLILPHAPEQALQPYYAALSAAAGLTANRSPSHATPRTQQSITQSLLQCNAMYWAAPLTHTQLQPQLVSYLESLKNIPEIEVLDLGKEPSSE
jgi:hypothetical protein